MSDSIQSNGATLIATLGTEPQVVTACTDLLLKEGNSLVEVIVLHTFSPGSEVAAALERLRHAFEQPPYADKLPLKARPLTDRHGQPLRDTATPQEIEQAFRCLYNEVRRAKLAGRRVDLAIAGGRKPLALFGMVTAQLLCDESDRLWYLYSTGEFLTSKRLHPLPGDQVQLVPIPFIPWSQVSPTLTDLVEIEDPFEALQQVRATRLAERLAKIQDYLQRILTPAEGRVVSLLAQEGLSDNQIAERLSLSPRTVEGQLRKAYNKAAVHWDLEKVDRASLIALVNLYFTIQK